MKSKIKDKYDHRQIEDKWSKIWEEKRINSTNLKTGQNPYYNLMMYPYPSAEGLHVGNMYAFTGSDIHGRYKRMMGFEVFEPIGFDSGGIHSENFAIKMGVHPKKMTEKNIANFTKQLKMTGNMYDWEHTLEAMDPDYYKWTQWIFTKLFEKGLAYKKKSYVTWCPSCKTTVSDEQTEKKIRNLKNEKQESEKIVKDKNEEVTVCERCKTEIERKLMNQWFFKITDYAERLLNNTSKLNWPEKVLTIQKNWIGKSEGALIKFKIKNSNVENKEIEVFTTRPDTLYGCSFFVLAPEHWLVKEITSKEQRKEVEKYLAEAKRKTEQDRKMMVKDKTGVFTGGYVINPANNKKVPVWVADYVLMDYGEGAVMGVPAHDQRDFEFAKKYDLEIIPVIDVGVEYDIDKWQEIYHDKGKIVNSSDWNGLEYPDNFQEIIEYLENKGIGRKKITYKLRDWCISRQRYWGPPIPMIYCEQCAKRSEEIQEMAGWHVVPEKDLPVLLPEIEDYLPDGSGKSPLFRHKEFMKTNCPKCGGIAKRESDVSDTFLDSSWYFLRYPSTTGGDINSKESEEKAFLPEITRKWLPVSQYCGGAEHAVLHLMYSRFITMVLHDMGYLNFEEPFPNFYAHGLIIKDGAKMSKSKGNIINPDEYIIKYGTDVFRLYLSFIGPYADGGDFRDSGIAGMQKFVRRIWRLYKRGSKIDLEPKQREKLERMRHKTIKKVTKGIERFKYNTAVAGLMEYIREMETIGFRDQDMKTFVLLIAPFAPYIAEELWQEIIVSDKNEQGELVSVADMDWPKYEEELIMGEEVIIVIQVNGKLRGEIKIDKNRVNDKEYVIERAKNLEELKKFLDKGKIEREIYVLGKLVNLVVK